MTLFFLSESNNTTGFIQFNPFKYLINCTKMHNSAHAFKSYQILEKQYDALHRKIKVNFNTKIFCFWQQFCHFPPIWFPGNPMSISQMNSL